MSMADEYKIKPGREHLPVERPVYFSGDSFGDSIRQRRTELGLTLRQVSEATGIHHARLSRWERGEQRPETAEVLPALADALHMPIGDLCRRAGKPLSRGLPHLAPYLHLKYGEHLPSDILHELIAHCEEVLNRHGIGQGEAA
jgi:transcriptional regulator with XRE-family HTH domain